MKEPEVDADTIKADITGLFKETVKRLALTASGKAKKWPR